MFTCDIDLSGFRRAAAKTIDEIQVGTLTAVRLAAQEGAQEAKQVGQFKDRTGNLRGNIYAKFVSGNVRGAKWAIISPEKYSVFVENGTRPHIIEATNAKALRWVSGGFTFFAKFVRHPGTKGFFFMSQAYAKAERVLYRELGALGNKVARIWL